MAKPKKAKQTTKGSETSKAIERSPEPPQSEGIHAEATEPHEAEPPPEVLTLDSNEQAVQPSAPKGDTAPAPSQEDKRNLDQDNGGELSVSAEMPRKRSNAVAAGNSWPQEAGPATVKNNDWGVGSAEVTDTWGIPQHANSPAMNSNAGGATDSGWENAPASDWGINGGGAAAGWESPAAPAQPTVGRKNKKDKKDKRNGASKVSFALDEPSAATPTAPPPPPPPPAPMARGGWASPAATATAFDDYDDGNGWGNNAPARYWDEPGPTQAAAAPPAAAKAASSGWLGWASEAKGLPQSQTTQNADTMRRHRAPQAAAQYQQAQPFQAQLTTHIQAVQQGLQAQEAQLQARLQQQAQLQAVQQAQKAHQAQHQAQLQAQRAHQAQHTASAQQARGDHRQPNHRQQQHGFAQDQSHRAPPMQQQDSWGSNTGWSGGGWGPNWTEAIPEEDEGAYDEDEGEYDEDEDEDEGDVGWRADTNAHLQYSPATSYPYDPPAGGSYPPAAHAAAARSPAQRSGQQIWTPSPSESKLMSAGMKTTVFEHAPPRNGMGEMTTQESFGAAILPAQRALYGGPPPARLAKDRIHWMFNPDKDPRVSELLRWVSAFQNGLATLGVEKFLETGQRGALIANADYRTSGQPAFDWLTLADFERTRDRTFQESVVFYDPAFQVIVFVFLLSTTGNSMAVWRRRLNVPDGLRLAHQEGLLAAKAQLKKDYPVYVDELPSKDDAAGRPKKKRGWFRKWLNFKW